MLQQNLIKNFEKSFRGNWELPALSDYFKNETFTYGMVAEEIARLHILFECCKIKKGDKVAVLGRNNTRWCISYLAVITYGGVVVPILQDFNSDDIHHILNHSEALSIFAGDQYWDMINPPDVEKIRSAFSLTDFSCLFGNAKKIQDELNKKFTEKYPDGFRKEHVNYPDIDNKEMVMINYTSGTTGFTKGVMISANNLMGNVQFGIDARLSSSGEKCLSFLPLAHAFGCAFDFLYAISVGVHITLLGKIPSPKVLVEALKTVKPKVIFTVPLIMEKIYKKQILPALERKTIKMALKLPFVSELIFEKIKKQLVDVFGGNFTQVIIGWAPLNPEVEDFLYKIKFPFTVGYGMTECAPLISYSYYKEFVPRSCGRPIKFMEVRIDSEQPSLIPGEIQVRGENVMIGYYKDDEATKKIFTDDGWLRTGDIATIGQDNSLFIRGRSKNMILSSNGQNIYPEEIEYKSNNMPCVVESIVVERNGRLVALVYPDYDYMDKNIISEKEMEVLMNRNKDLLNSTLPVYEKISDIVIYPTEFEKTPKKSIKRYLYNI
ncbi:MAG: AMP-binding protein [Rikenellaceae bacterium]|nr:AMP-binding protein [Rikenellaceae bacterium]